MAACSSIIGGKFSQTEELGGYGPKGCKESDMTVWLKWLSMIRIYEVSQSFSLMMVMKQYVLKLIIGPETHLMKSFLGSIAFFHHEG